MFTNPFTPIFGGKPEFFFGRQEILERFDRAMIDSGSEDRALFITGTRGSGKTALLEQLSMRAAAKGRKVIDLSSENTVELLMRNLVRHGEETRTLSPEASVSILGTGASLSAGSVSKTTQYTTADLQMVFLDFCKKLEGGLFVSIDEIQKVPEADLTAICDSFQMASRKGLDVILAVAGLPYSHPQVIKYPGCTYLRRAAQYEIGLLSRDEARGAFIEAFRRTRGLSIGNDALDELVGASYGHPYRIQLLGYYLVLSCNSRSKRAEYTVNVHDVEGILADADDSYERRALAPMLDELTNAEREYLTAMSKAMGDQPMVKTSAVADALGKNPSAVGKVRDSLLNLGIVAVPEYGSLMFAIPLLRQFVLKERGPERNIERALEWGL